MWTLNGIRIFVQKFPVQNANIMARLQPLEGGTVLHKFGYESTVYSLGGIIVGTEDEAALRAMAKTHTTYTLVTPYATIADVSVVSVKTNQQLGVLAQNMRTDLACDAPVYDIDIELNIED